MNIAEIIGKLRDGVEPEKAEISYIIRAITSGEMHDAQIGAFAMAVMWRGLSKENGIYLTKAMRDSGEVLTWDVEGPIVDKHSTGGVGDCVSLALAPILAATGLFVPMISGRGLGHSGGTLDKLEAIPRFSTALGADQMQIQLQELGCLIIGQSAKLAPADRRLYAIRDITGTVPSIDLIAASILSKKLAAGLEYLVLDVKCGHGAFMKTRAQAKELAHRLVELANRLGCKTEALVTNMNLPLCASAGNALEVAEVLKLLEGEKQTRLYEITEALCVNIMQRAGKSRPEEQFEKVIASGAAMEKFLAMIAAQGGRFKDQNDLAAALPKAPHILDFNCPDTEFYGFDAYQIGMAVVELGGGRRRAEDKIDPSVGISDIALKGGAGDLVARIHAQDEASARQAATRLQKAILQAPQAEPTILEVIS